MDLDKLNLVKLDYGGLDLGSSQFSLRPQPPQKGGHSSNLQYVKLTAILK